MNILSHLQLVVHELRQFVWTPIIWLSYLILSRVYVNQVDFWTSLVWSSHPSPSSVYSGYVEIVNSLNTSKLIILPHPLQLVLIFLSQPLQGVRELGQLFEYLFLIGSFYLVFSRVYVNLVNCLKTSNMIILSHSLQPVRDLGQLFAYL